MIGSYQMAFINLIGSLLILGASLFYKFIFPKKNINLFALLIIISILPLISLLRIGDYESGDFNIHIYRTMSFYQNLLDGNFIPSWAGMLNGTYGYPLFIFINPLPYYLMSFFHFLGFSFIASIKLFLGFAFVLSGIFMYLFTKETLKNDLAAFTASVFYLFAPYHLVDLHFRNDVGEILCFTLIPLLLFFTYKLFRQGTIIYIFWTGLVFALLIMSHQAIALLTLWLVIPLLVMGILREPGKLMQIKLWIKIFVAFGIGIFISAYVWIPYLTYVKYTLASEIFTRFPIFVNLPELLYSPWRFGFLFQGPKGELSFLVGYLQIFVFFVLLIYLLFKRRRANHARELTIWLATTAFLFYLLTSFSEIIWLIVPVMKNMLIASRILSVFAFSISFVAGYFALLNLNRKAIIFLVIILAIGTTLLNWGNRRVIPEITDATLKNNLPYSSSQGEALACIGNTIWFSNKCVWINKVPISKIDVIHGVAKIKTLSITSTSHYFSVNSTDGATLKDNTLYFPGWEVMINGKQIDITFKNKQYPGIITFNVPSGETQITVAYKDLLMLQVLKLIFVLSIAIILSYTVGLVYKNQQLVKAWKKVRKRFS
jgi:hypothetical protein